MSDSVKTIDVVCEETKEFTRKLISDRNIGGGRMGIEDGMCNTNLISKHYSPLTIRRCNMINGWPMFVALICDEDLSDLDGVINGVVDACTEEGIISNNIQNMRNFTGLLSETLQKHYNTKKKNCVEGIYILLSIDKTMIANAHGDTMVHQKCLNEIMGILNIAPHV